MIQWFGGVVVLASQGSLSDICICQTNGPQQWKLKTGFPVVQRFEGRRIFQYVLDDSSHRDWARESRESARMKYCVASSV